MPRFLSLIAVPLLIIAACTAQRQDTSREPPVTTTEGLTSMTVDLTPPPEVIEAAAVYAAAFDMARWFEWIDANTTTTTVPRPTTTVPREPARGNPPSSGSAPPGGSVWDDLAQCESGGDWAHSGGSDSFDGGLQFHVGTWRSYGGTAYADRAYNATREQQIAIAEKVLADVGWGAWPACSRKLGLR